MKKFLFSIRDTLFVVIVLVITTIICRMIHSNPTINDGNIIAIKILAIMIVSAKTDGYHYGIISAIILILLENYLFTFPYSTLNFELNGYPITFAIMFIVAILTSTLMTKLKQNAYEAYLHEKKTKELMEDQQQLIIESEKEAMRGNLLRAISHDLRTPLTSISGSASALIELDEVDKTTVHKLASSIRDDSNWLIHMVENLLTITRMGDEQTLLNKTEELVEEVVAEACTRIRNNYPKAKLNVTVPDEVLLIPMDFTLIEQVLINLIENAIKYAGNNSIDITVKKEEKFVRFEVRDHGLGLSDEILESLLTQKPILYGLNDNKRGMGIGLSICYSIIKAHNGEATVCNAVDGGAIFTFSLPMKA